MNKCSNYSNYSNYSNHSNDSNESNDALLLNPIYIKGTRGNSHLLRWCIDGEG